MADGITKQKVQGAEDAMPKGLLQDGATTWLSYGNTMDADAGPVYLANPGGRPMSSGEPLSGENIP